MRQPTRADLLQQLRRDAEIVTNDQVVAAEHLTARNAEGQVAAVTAKAAAEEAAAAVVPATAAANAATAAAAQASSTAAQAEATVGAANTAAFNALVAANNALGRLGIVALSGAASRYGSTTANVFGDWTTIEGMQVDGNWGGYPCIVDFSATGIASGGNEFTNEIVRHDFRLLINGSIVGECGYARGDVNQRDGGPFTVHIMRALRLGQASIAVQWKGYRSTLNGAIAPFQRSLTVERIGTP